MRWHLVGWGLCAGLVFMACSSDDSSSSGGINLDAGAPVLVPVDSGGVSPPANDSGSPDAAGDDDNPDADVDSGPKIIKPTGALGTVDISTATADFTVTEASTQFNTVTGEISFFSAANGTIRAAGTGVIKGIGFSIVDQGANLPPLAVWTFKSLTVPATGGAHFTGANAVAFAAQGDISIAGLLSVRGNCTADPSTPGPGGFGPSQPAIVPGTPDKGFDGNTVAVGGGKTACGGGGGGGGGTAGGGGGFAKNNGVSSNLGTGGGARAAFLTDPIVSGGAGGGGTGSRGGAGGGAIQLFTRGAITVTGTVDAGGCGGNFGSVGTACVGAGGGGAGGTLFFEAGSVSFAASSKVLANGGAGGGGTSGPSGSATKGADGSATDATPAVGGTSNATNGTCPNGQSGNPPAGSTDGECDGNANSFGVSAPGGAGGQGVVAIKTIGSPSVNATAVVSPAAVTGAVTFQ